MYLSNHSYFSLRYGTMPVETLVEKAVANSVPFMALTDINNSTGVMDFYKVCTENNIKPIAGIEFRSGNKYLYTALARNNEGFCEINEFLSAVNRTKEPLPPAPPPFQNAYVVYPFGRIPTNTAP